MDTIFSPETLVTLYHIPELAALILYRDNGERMYIQNAGPIYQAKRCHISQDHDHNHKKL
jgi:hypothetical protein